MLFRSAFFKINENKLLIFQKWQKWHFWWLITFVWCVFKNIKQNNIWVFIVFKAESEPKHKEKISLGGFSSKNKNAFFRG